MLQQTQVATVIDYFHRFLEAFPTVTALAGAEEPAVLAQWSGLGYYRRARQLHAAAKVIEREHGGVFPCEFDAILALPGIGRYTAGAIASFAFDDKRPILEANTIRLFARLLALRDDPSSTRSQKRLWQFAEQLLPARSSAGELNQALMELGSLVCKPKDPTCLVCPVQRLCPTFAAGLQHLVPHAKPKAKPIAQTHGLLLIERRGRYLMRLNPPGQWWEGLWDFPRLEFPPSARQLFERQSPSKNVAQHATWVSDAIATRFLAEFGLKAHAIEYFKTLRHGVTKYRIELHCFHATAEPGIRHSSLPGDWKWVAPNSASSLPLTSTAAKISRMLSAAAS